MWYSNYPNFRVNSPGERLHLTRQSQDKWVWYQAVYGVICIKETFTAEQTMLHFTWISFWLLGYLEYLKTFYFFLSWGCLSYQFIVLVLYNERMKAIEFFSIMEEVGWEGDWLSLWMFWVWHIDASSSGRWHGESQSYRWAWRVRKENGGLGIVLKEGGRSHGYGVDVRMRMFPRRELRWPSKAERLHAGVSHAMWPQGTQTQRTTWKEKKL